METRRGRCFDVSERIHLYQNTIEYIKKRIYGYIGISERIHLH